MTASLKICKVESTHSTVTCVFIIVSNNAHNGMSALLLVCFYSTHNQVQGDTHLNCKRGSKIGSLELFYAYLINFAVFH